MLDLVWLIPALPLAGFLCILLLGRKLGDPGAGYFATAMVGASFLVTVGVFFVLVVAAAEVVVGLGIIVAILRRRPNATADDLTELKG